jgi:hypothetical protein
MPFMRAVHFRIARTENRTMKLLMFCGAAALITCASSSVDGDILLEMREEFAQMEVETRWWWPS